jgi:mRNA interferase MazF
MVAIARGEIWWADLSEPVGSQPGFRRPVVVIQGDPFNRSRIGTVVVVPLTSNLQWADAPGNVLLAAEVTRLSKDSVANVSQIIAVDKGMLTERISKLPQNKLDLLYAGIDIVLDR